MEEILSQVRELGKKQVRSWKGGAWLDYDRGNG